MSSLHYACTALLGTNKTGELKPDEHGYYYLCLGALNFFNSAGIYYDYESSKHIFESSSSFMRRISTGNLYSEEDHPEWEQGRSLQEYIHRIKFIDSHNVCAHIRSVEVIPTDNAQRGGKVMMVYGWVKPDRERGAFLKAALDNPNQNVCFSLRALCDDNIINGVKVRTITDLITFDWVIEPGISRANKFASPALESLGNNLPGDNLIKTHDSQDIMIPISVLKDSIKLAQSKNTAAGNIGVCVESAVIDDLSHIANKYDNATIRKPTAISMWK